MGWLKGRLKRDLMEDLGGFEERWKGNLGRPYNKHTAMYYSTQISDLCDYAGPQELGRKAHTLHNVKPKTLTLSQTAKQPPL